ncbi:MAG: hormogonium polysaccharide biosynthesis protein HpsA [Nostocales cyanobacterium 94392]|nr:hormogonium polysaccharide biosynthesis protein HpsA [Nostocales cyanobacterium 94392]
MYRNRKLVRAIKKFFRKFRRKSSSTVKKQSLWLLRTFIVTKKRKNWANSGFVLPTVAMVSLVVVLLTIAIMFRSFERSNNASNVRVNQAVLNAATPAIDRARAKIDKLFSDPRLPRSTPNDFSLDQIISNNVEEFTFGDESQLTLFHDINGNGSRNEKPASLTDDENLKTAWKYPVDTDNNGKFDSYTLYSINFRNPPQTNGNPARARNPLEARTPPMNETRGSNVCDRGNNTSAQLVGSQGWYQRGSTLRRSIFVYTTTVPITDTRGLGSEYEEFKGNQGFAALEYQQDRERRPLTNNAVLYGDDLEISPGGGINLNGRILTNSNLFAARRFEPIRFYLVSSPDSCYFSERNSKIVVGGNVANARISDTGDQNPVEVDLFKEINAGQNPKIEKISSTNKTINLAGGTQVAYNSRAYEMRLDLLVDAGAALPKTSLPIEIQEELKKRVDAGKDENTEKRALLRSYFRKRTRRVPYGEVSLANTNTDAVKGYTKANVLGGTTGDEMRPPKPWVFPFNPADGKSHVGYANLTLRVNGRKVYLPAQKTDFPEPEGEEEYLGDRIVVGNNLPQMWWDEKKKKFVTQEEAGQEISNSQWDKGDGTRKRFPQVSELDDLGETGRDQFWEESAAVYPKDALDVVGGLRVVTGAGIYLPKGYNITESAKKYNDALSATDKVWSDQMAVPENLTPVSTTPTVPDNELPYTGTPYLQMRATAVYHFQRSAYDPEKPSSNPQTPIACVSSFYDPTNENTAKNRLALPSFPNLTDPSNKALVDLNRNANGRSNNGIVYTAPTRTRATYQTVLNYQAQLRYSNGRYVHKELRKALAKGSGNLTLSEKSTIDSAICALQIMDGSISPSNLIIPHGAIRETAFLDARQVKAVDKPAAASATTYDLDVELRQPLEIRATVLDLKALKNKLIGTTTNKTTEYLLPNSGIIYATRDDALPDISDDTDFRDDNDERIETSATDFILDPTRRPNGIMLINGEELNRSTTNQKDKPEEKGLILASNLPVYIKGDFNKHQHEEFTNKLNATWSNFYSRTKATLNSNFACRPGQFTGCTTGEKWRSATVIADAITVLSGNFQEGFRNQGDYNLRDNWGYSPLGYDLNGINGIETTTIPPVQGLDESTLRIDLNGNGNMTDSKVITMNERALGVDLNDDGKITNTSVDITEKNIPSVVARRLNGFWDNNFVTSYNWWERAAGFPRDSLVNDIKSSYFNNFATPIQRRASFPEYVMEICRKSTVAACQPDDWVVGYDANNNGKIDWNNAAEADIKAVDSGTSQIKPKDTTFTASRLGAGTTARPALNPDDQRFPRRVAFLRDATGNLILDGSSPKQPIPLGIASATDNPTPGSPADNDGQVNYYPSSTTDIPAGTPYPAYSRTNRPRLHSRALWFKTRNGGNDNYGWNFPLSIANPSGLTSSNPNIKPQPLLEPVLQISVPITQPIADRDSVLFNSKLADAKDSPNNWVQVAGDTETNLVFAQGDTPARPNESNGGLENFVRYLESWDEKTHKASGSFIQYKRSSYATAPWYPIVANYTDANRAFSTSGTIFGYPQAYRIAVNNQSGTTLGRTPFYIQPENRSWGFDVALLTQLPDLFSQRFTAPPTGDPNEFYREVSRDDSWVSTLLCAADTRSPANYGTAPSSKYGNQKRYAVPQDQRPSGPSGCK